MILSRLLAAAALVGLCACGERSPKPAPLGQDSCVELLAAAVAAQDADGKPWDDQGPPVLQATLVHDGRILGALDAAAPGLDAAFAAKPFALASSRGILTVRLYDRDGPDLVAVGQVRIPLAECRLGEVPVKLQLSSRQRIASLLLRFSPPAAPNQAQASP